MILPTKVGLLFCAAVLLCTAAVDHQIDDVVPEVSLLVDTHPGITIESSAYDTEIMKGIHGEPLDELTVAVQVLEAFEDVWDKAHPLASSSGSSAPPTPPPTEKSYLDLGGMTDAQKAGYMQVFAVLDKNHDGHIDSPELLALMHKMFHNPTPQELKAMMAHVNGLAAQGPEGVIDEVQFIALIDEQMKQLSNAIEVAQTFNIFDTDHNGFLTSTEIQSTMGILGITFPDELVLGYTISQADITGDGKIDQTEFLHMITTNEEHDATL